MRFLPQDPDLETIFRRIEDQDYDLQPDFQRGEVWPLQKKRRLIDSVLRGWHIPPIHLVAREDGRSDVLDGQQRLTAIRDFMKGEFKVDGKTEPLNPAIEALDGFRYGSLPSDVARAFRKFTIRMYELVDFDPDEPHELFFRLNQPTSLNEAEKRNAFIGDARNQVKELVDWAVDEGLLSPNLGFSNARLAYHDMMARVLVTIDSQSLSSKVTASRITARYRSGEPFNSEVVRALKTAIRIVVPPILEQGLRPNKATLHSWFCAGAQISLNPSLDNLNHDALPKIISHLEQARWAKSQTDEERIVAVFQNRSTARVADVSSVILRDLIIWMYLAKVSDAVESEKIALAKTVWQLVDKTENLEESLLAFASDNNWGELEWH